MKKIILTFVAALFCTALSAQQSKNTLTFAPSLFGIGSNEGASLATAGFEFDRVLRDKFSVSAMWFHSGYAWHLMGGLDDDYDRYFHFAGAKLNYTIPVSRRWLLFRVGLGAGVSRHYEELSDHYMSQHRVVKLVEASPKYKFHVIADAWWVVRAGRRVEFRFAPLLVSPSQLLVGSTLDDPEKTPFAWCNFMTLGLGVRF